MNHNVKLMQEALKGSKEAFKELYSDAGSGNPEAQYYLALYYKEVKDCDLDSNYNYWMKKAKDNGYDMANTIDISTEQVVDNPSPNEREDNEIPFKAILKRFSFSGRINRLEYLISIAVSIVVFVLSSNIIDDTARSVICLIVDIFWLSQGARRLHDFGASGIWVIIPVISWIFIAFPKGDVGENEFGPAPQ